MSHPTGMLAGEGEAELVYLGEKRIDGLVTQIIRGKEQTSGWREGENRKMEGKESKDWIQRKLLKINMEALCDRRGSVHQVVLLHFSLVPSEQADPRGREKQAHDQHFKKDFHEELITNTCQRQW